MARLLIICCLLFGGAGALESRPLPVSIFVVSHGWHTGIVVPRREITGGFWSEQAELSGEAFLEFGWGDAEFYQAENSPFWASLKAAFMPSAAVLHVVGFNEPVVRFFPASGVVAVELARPFFSRLVRFLDETVVESGVHPVSPLGSGLYGRSYFYAAHGEYTVFNNCNHWVARALAAAGLPVDPADAMTATAVFEQARRVGVLLRPEP